MDRPSPISRTLAPLALGAFAVVLLIVVATSLSAGGGEEGGNQLGAQTATGPGTRTVKNDLPQKIYIVKPGDTFGSIAEKTGISVEELSQLNPNLDPQALISGQRVKIR